MFHEIVQQLRSKMEKKNWTLRSHSALQGSYLFENFKKKSKFQKLKIEI